MSERIKLAAVVGPTASGKTALAVEIAKRFSGEVVSCDSMQLYRGMEIASAAPTEEEMSGVPHYFVGICEPSEEFSVARYCDEARKIIGDIAARGRLPILCGGTGLYYSSLADGITFNMEEGDRSLRESIAKEVEALGGEGALRLLASFDSETAERLFPNDTKRIIRAIEIYRSTGITMSEQIRRSRETESAYDLCAIGLTCRDRAKLYERIEKRVDIMVEQGLEEEARRQLSASGATAAQAIGHKELLPYFRGEASFEECIATLKQSTRRYAKRQLSWFRRDSRISWLYIDEDDDLPGHAADIINEHYRRGR